MTETEAIDFLSDVAFVAFPSVRQWLLTTDKYNATIRMMAKTLADIDRDEADAVIDSWIERCQLAATEAVCDELHELLDLYKIDGTIHDLDQHKPETMQSTLASVLCELMHRLQKAEAAIHETINENNHLADGDNCTLRKLLAHVKQFPGQA